MSYGFVYVLSNHTMPGIYKIGATEGSPSKRCNELSGATGVPAPFTLVCYAEFQNCWKAEKVIHSELASVRVNNSREFFRGPLKEIIELLRMSEYACSFCDVEVTVALFEDRASKKNDLETKLVSIPGGLE